jgi:hypothetical protein
MSFNAFPGKDETEADAIVKTYELFMYGGLSYITKSFCNNALKW